ncbi:phosphoribosylanthranilate isomerase [Pseudofulvibacter geojedonensis]|uniref:N-(5'-phosphoribosyl)anthranilate isomerase n=1 Tax=Pseudofulvibacter geojedonensis TaxID=1123758 RepID=A0ABW3I534_9FLAO
MKLKICGMKYQENINQVTEINPDFLGFIFYEKSSRFFDGEIPNLTKEISKVGVFVNASIEYVLDKVNHHHLDYIQLHGNETPEYCKKLKAKTNSKTIKVFSIKDEFNFTVLSQFEVICDYFLFDTKGTLPGGNGYSFDWSVLENYPSTKPYFLSGGIGLENVTDLQEFLSSPAAQYCYAIDVNSKFEIEPGLKDTTKLTEFKELLKPTSNV